MDFAVATAMLGLGAVFAALGLLVVVLKAARGVSERLGKARPSQDKPDGAPVRSGVGLMAESVSSSRDTRGEQLAAAVAVGLHLEGISPPPGEDVVAAIATALALYRMGESLSPPPAAALAGWSAAGRMDAQAWRQRLQLCRPARR